jgi:hypothetical protein
VMSRAHDVDRALPTWIKAAAASSPVEIAIMNYGSMDDLRDVVNKHLEWRILGRYGWWMGGGQYFDRDTYHKAHAWNLAARCANDGDYLVFAGADALFDEWYIAELRKLIADGCVWMRGRHYKGILCIKRDEFITAGGYDERFEFSGEDKELDERLQRRGAKFGLLPDGLVRTIRTPNRLKFANARGGITKAEAIAHGAALRKENEAAELLVANEGREWGSWEGPCWD